MKVLIIFAHPDDESFSTGGTIALLKKQGADICLISATKGEAGQTGGLDMSPEELGEARAKELQNAANVLGISQIHFLGHLDGTLQTLSVEQTSREILPLIKKENPDLIITFDEEGSSRHPDHIHIGKAATLAFREYMKSAGKHVRLYYILNISKDIRTLEKLGISYAPFGKVEGCPDSEVSTVCDISDTYQTKCQAIRCHKTQCEDGEMYFGWEGHIDVKKEYFKLALENRIM